MAVGLIVQSYIREIMANLKRARKIFKELYGYRNDNLSGLNILQNMSMFIPGTAAHPAILGLSSLGKIAKIRSQTFIMAQ